MHIGRNVPKQPVENVHIPMMQWANGLTQGKLSGLTRFSGFVGWHIEREQSSELDAAFDGFPTVKIRHPRKGGDPVEKDHWSLGESMVFYPLTGGFPGDSIFASLRMPNECAEAGIGLRWEEEARRSKLALYGYIKAGMAYHLVTIPAKSLITDEFFAAYAAHLQTLQVVDTMIDREKHPTEVSFHEFGLPFVAGPEKSFGKGETTVVTTIRCGHPDVIDREYLKKMWATIPTDRLSQDWPLVQALAHELTFKAPEAEYEGNG